jgi:anti-sigma B factor antagonist
VDLDIRQNGSICCLKLKGPLKYGEGVKQLDEAVEGALTSGHTQLLLDLSAMPYIDSSGIGAIVDALRQAKKLGGDAKLVSPSPFAAKTFKMVGILTLFKVYDSEAEAVQACKPEPGVRDRSQEPRHRVPQRRLQLAQDAIRDFILG